MEGVKRQPGTAATLIKVAKYGGYGNYLTNKFCFCKFRHRRKSEWVTKCHINRPCTRKGLK